MEAKGAFKQKAFKRKGSQQKNIRKRKVESDTSSSDDETTVHVKEKKSSSSNFMVHSSHRSGEKREKISVSDSDSDKDSLIVSYKSTRSVAPVGPSDMGATSTLQTETEKDKDSRSIFERSHKINEELKGKDDDKVYRGLNNYSKFTKNEDTAANAPSFRKGPIRAPDHIRSTVRWDYQPDICKDFKETGYCGFGDSCKFMHDRTDYKQGWQLELEMNNHTYGKDDSSKYEISSDEEDLPFRCFICRSSFKDPIVTKCQHYFCQKCAVSHHQKSSRCFICGKQTMGLFNAAKKLEAKLAAAAAAEANH